METSLLFARRVARRTVTKQHRRFKKEQGKENRRRKKNRREREQSQPKGGKKKGWSMVLNLKIPAIRGAIVRKFEPMIYHRQWQRDRKKYHLISQMSNSPLRNIFRFNLSSLLSGFARWRGGEGGGGGTRGKKKKDIYKRGRGQPDNKRLRQSTITSYFPRYRSNQFCPSPKNNRPVPRSVSRRYSRREHSTCRSQVLQDSIQSRSCLTHPRIVEQEKEKEKKKEGRNTVVVLRARASSLLFPPSKLPFLRFTFSTVPRRFSVPVPSPRNYLFLFSTPF